MLITHSIPLPQAAVVSDYDAAAAPSSGSGSFAAALSSNLGAAYLSSYASTDAAFGQTVSEAMSPSQLLNPFESIKIEPGNWRGVANKINGVRKCKVRGSDRARPSNAHCAAVAAPRRTQSKL